MTAFYDIDTPVTPAKLARGDFEYLSPELIAWYDLYLSFTGGPTLERLKQEFVLHRQRATALKARLLFEGDERVIVISVPRYLDKSEEPRITHV